METGNFVKTLSTRRPAKTYPRCVAFADKARLILGGSDHGQVYIFDRKLGQVVEKIGYARKGGAEIIGVSPIFFFLPVYTLTVVAGARC